ncbi:MAG TPA: type II toxin-antitoxin system HicA family toxin [Desulfobacterales bacterium]|nr:type II toxin-antitoxin system HicA family toxin [Desulfobacterales bacterium]
MNRRALEHHLRAHGCFLNHHGGRHDIRVNPRTQAHAPVPGHATIKQGTARGICRILGITLPTAG